MPSIHLTNTFLEAATKILEKIYTKSGLEIPLRWPEVFNTPDYDMRRRFFSQHSIVPFGLLSQMGEATQAPLDSAGPGLTSTFFWQNFGLRYIISDDAQLEDPQSIFKEFPKMLRYSVDQTQEYLFWNILNLSFLSWAEGGYNLADGQPLISAIHPLTGLPGVTVSNFLGDVALTVESLQAVIIQFNLIKDDRGKLIRYIPKDIIYPPGLHQTVVEVLQAYFYPSTDQNRPNVVYNAVTPIAVQYLTPAQGPGPFPWWVTAGKGKLGRDAHSMFAALKYNKQRSYIDQTNQNLVHEAKIRVSMGAVDWRGIVGSGGA
jgi:hypothetical protein